MIKKIMNLKIRYRFILGLGLMLLPLIFIAIGAFTSLQHLTEAFEDTADEIVFEQIPIMRLQNSILKVNIPVHDYLTYRDKRSIIIYQRLSKEVDNSFNTAFKSDFGLGEEKEYLKQAYNEWKIARAIGYTLSDPDIFKDRIKQSNNKYEFNLRLKHASDDLEKIYFLSKQEIDEELKNAHKIRQRVKYGILSAFILGLFIAISAALGLTYSVLKPIGELDEGLKRFGSGELYHRIYTGNKDELGKLADEFNKMADKIEKDQDEMKYLSTHDYLTGLYNRSELYKELNAEQEKAVLSQHSISLLLLDIDYFKSINDQYGHIYGDQALQQVAKTLCETVREKDFVARYGGEEFAILLPDVCEKKTLEVAERIREKIASCPMKVQEENVNLTVSIGIAVFPKDTENVFDLIALADNALYAAKAEGRNQVRTVDMIKNN